MKNHHPINPIPQIYLKRLVIGLTLGLVMPFAVRADVTEFTLEQLMQMTVTSVSKKDQKLSEATAAIYVSPEKISAALD